MQFVPYRPEHLAQIALQPAQAAWREYLVRDAYAQSLALPGLSWSALRADGAVLGCAGLAPQWPGRVIAWGLFGAIPPFAWPAVVRKIRREFREALAAHGRHRIEITVPKGFGPGCRLALMLGFAAEGMMKEYGPDGSDHLLYAQILPEAAPCAH